MFQQLASEFLQKRERILIVAICLLAVLVRWPSLEQPFDNDGGARAYHARLILAGEPLYGTHHTGHHLPGIYYTYALAFILFGDSAWAVKFLLLLWTIPTLYLLYQLGSLLMDESTGLLAAAFYAILSAHVWLWGMTAETELFANLPRIAAVLVLLQLVLKQAPAWKFMFVGLLSAAAVLFKIIYLSPLMMAGVVLFVELWRNRTKSDAWHDFLGRTLWLGTGFIAGLLPFFLYFTFLGLLPRILLVFTAGQYYISASNVVPDAIPILGHWILYPLLPLYGLAYNNAALLIFSLAGFLLILIYKKNRLLLATYLAIWYLFSFIEAGVNLELFVHYYLLILPPLCLLAGWFLLRLFYDIKRPWQGRDRPMAIGLFLILLVIALSLSVQQNFSYYRHYFRYKTGQETLADSLRNGWPGFGERLARSLHLADYVREHTTADDMIYYWSNDVQLYYLTGRRSPIDMIWPSDVEAATSPGRIFIQQTKYIIIDGTTEPTAPRWFYEALSEHYVLEVVMDEQEIYRRVDQLCDEAVS